MLVKATMQKMLN